MGTLEYCTRETPCGACDRCECFRLEDHVASLQSKLVAAEKRVAELAESRAELAEQRNQLSIRLDGCRRYLLDISAPVIGTHDGEMAADIRRFVAEVLDQGGGSVGETQKPSAEEQMDHTPGCQCWYCRAVRELDER